MVSLSFSLARGQSFYGLTYETNNHEQISPYIVLTNLLNEFHGSTLNVNTAVIDHVTSETNDTVRYEIAGSPIFYQDAGGSNWYYSSAEDSNGDTFFRHERAKGWTTNGSLTLTAQDTWYAWTNWPNSDNTDGINFEGNGIAIGVTNAAGWYLVRGHISPSLNQASEDLGAALFRSLAGSGTTNVVPCVQTRTQMKTANKPYTMTLGTYLYLNFGDYLEIRFCAFDGAGRVVSLGEDSPMCFIMFKISN